MRAGADYNAHAQGQRARRAATLRARVQPSRRGAYTLRPPPRSRAQDAGVLDGGRSCFRWSCWWGCTASGPSSSSTAAGASSTAASSSVGKCVRAGARAGGRARALVFLLARVQEITLCPSPPPPSPRLPPQTPAPPMPVFTLKGVIRKLFLRLAC